MHNSYGHAINSSGNAIPLPMTPHVARQRLLTQIVGPSMAPVTIIVAPAGYGKTTLATQLAASMPGECVWLSISEKMNIPEFFLGRLLQRLGGSAPDGEPVHPEEVLDSLRELATRAPRVTLFLDDYHLVDSREIHHFMQRLLHDQPDNVHVVFMSRLPIPFALARDYVCDRVRCVTAEDLSFTVDEVRVRANGGADGPRHVLWFGVRPEAGIASGIPARSGQ